MWEFRHVGTVCLQQHYLIHPVDTVAGLTGWCCWSHVCPATVVLIQCRTSGQTFQQSGPMWNGCVSRGRRERVFFCMSTCAGTFHDEHVFMEALQYAQINMMHNYYVRMFSWAYGRELDPTHWEARISYVQPEVSPNHAPKLHEVVWKGILVHKAFE